MIERKEEGKKLIEQCWTEIVSIVFLLRYPFLDRPNVKMTIREQHAKLFANVSPQTGLRVLMISCQSSSSFLFEISISATIETGKAIVGTRTTKSAQFCQVLPFYKHPLL